MWVTMLFYKLFQFKDNLAAKFILTTVAVLICFRFKSTYLIALRNVI